MRGIGMEGNGDASRARRPRPLRVLALATIVLAAPLAAGVYLWLNRPRPVVIPLPPTVTISEAKLKLPESLPERVLRVSGIPTFELQRVLWDWERAKFDAARDFFPSEEEPDIPATVQSLDPLESYPLLKPLRELASRGIYVMELMGQERFDTAYYLAGISQAAIMQQLDAVGLADTAVPQIIGQWEAMALQPNWGWGSPLVGWLEDAAIIAPNAADFAMVAEVMESAPEVTGVMVGMWYGFRGSQVRTVGRLEIAEGPSPRIVLHEMVSETETKPMAHEDPILIEDEFAGYIFEGEFGSKGIMPHGAYAQIIAAAPHANETWARIFLESTPVVGDEIEGGIYGGLRRTLPYMRSAAPLVTQTAWCILATTSVYAQPVESRMEQFRSQAAPLVRRWGDFLVRWKRGPEPAPLSTLDEQSSPNDVYPVLMVYLGLSAAAQWMDEADTPDAWGARLEELRIELAARLLQEDQCLTCPSVVMPLVEASQGLSPAVISALEILPACAAASDPHGVLPDCEMRAGKAALQ